MKIALLEDDAPQAALLSNWLIDCSHDVTHRELTKDYVKVVLSEPFDMLIMDWELPDGTGVEALSRIREKLDWRIPVLFATQRDDESDIVTALDAGADDFLVKPLKQKECLARINALGRRAGVLEKEVDNLSLGPITLDLKKRQATVNGEPVKLTGKDFDVAWYLTQNLGRLLSRDHLLSKIWGRDEGIQTRTVDVHVSRVRRSLGINPEMGYQIKTVYQHGYRLEKVE